jgi:hypothetical protein
MFKRFTQGRLALLLGSLVSVAMLTFFGAAGAAGAAGAQAAPRAALTPAYDVSTKPVLSSDYGKARSRVVGSFGKNGSVSGTFRPNRFVVNKAGRLIAVGQLRATLVRGNGKVVGTAVERVRIPVAAAAGNPIQPAAALAAPAANGCDVLNLVLGPLDLNLLGLQVDLERVVLNIIAVPGAGNLLGNLLCAVAGLLDTPGLLTQISQILNAILGLLRL